MTKNQKKKKVVLGRITGIQEDGPLYNITIQMTLDQAKPLIEKNLLKMVVIEVGPVD